MGVWLPLKGACEDDMGQQSSVTERERMRKHMVSTWFGMHGLWRRDDQHSSMWQTKEGGQ
jgi:hypothetical protein